jgi:hypothetical protein
MGSTGVAGRQRLRSKNPEKYRLLSGGAPDGISLALARAGYGVPDADEPAAEANSDWVRPGLVADLADVIVGSRVLLVAETLGPKGFTLAEQV